MFDRRKYHPGMTRHVVIAGAGIAGPLLALALRRAGLEPELVEAYAEAEMDGAGAWLSLAVNGLDALRTLGVREAVLGVSFPTSEVLLRNGAGRALGVASLGSADHEGITTRTMRRSSLHRVLLDALARASIPVRFGVAVREAEPSAAGVSVALSDGSSREAALLVGADGVHSRVRSLIDPAAPRPRETQMGNVGGFVPPGRGPAVVPGTYEMIFGARAFFGYVVAPSGEVWWFANPPTPHPPGCDARWLASLFEGERGPMAELVRATPHPLRFVLQHELPRVPRWSRGAMVILGDAAHAASPTSGQGVSLAAEDAVVLARALRDLPVEAALASFERQRRGRVERVVAEAARMSSTKIPGVLGRTMRDWMLPLVLSFATRAQRDWLFDHPIAWDEPSPR